MSLRRYISTLLLVVASLLATRAEIPVWDIQPAHEKLTRYHEHICAFLSHGKWGLIGSGDRRLLPADYDFITPFVNGYALAGVVEGSRHRLLHIIDENGSVVNIDRRLYLPADCPYVSEGLLAVCDSGGRYGYISSEGRDAIDFSFDGALPFKDGRAPVKRGNYYFYISRNYGREPDSRTILRVSFNDGEMTQASCFSAGIAAVAYNSQYALIDTQGRTMGKISRAEFTRVRNANNAPPADSSVRPAASSTYSVFTENNLCGLRVNDEIVLAPQFDSVSPQYADGAFLAACRGKYGILKLLPGHISFSLSSTAVDVGRDGTVSPVSLSCAIPPAVADARLRVDLGDGNWQDMTPLLHRDGANVSLDITPRVAPDALSCSVRGSLDCGGLTVASFEKSFEVNRPVRLRVSPPGPAEIRANKDRIATFCATVYNDSPRPVTVTVSWTTNSSPRTISIPARGRQVVSGSIAVESEFSRNIGIVLSSGEKASANIRFKPYF